MPKKTVEQDLCILLVDDEEIIHKSVGGFLEKMGYRVMLAETAEQGLKIFQEQSVDIVISDIKMPGMGGLAFLEAIGSLSQDTEVILMTGHGDLDTAVDALRKGAFDFFRKPVVLQELLLCLQKTRRHRQMRQEKDRIQKKLDALLRSTPESIGRYEILGESTAIKNVLGLVKKVAISERTTVLIEGESGTGKELVAQAIHRQSPRNEAPFISVNCTAIPDTLLESELFGHEKGAFTDARESRPGVFELGEGGTLFMDEIGDMNLAAQAKILRSLEERCVRRVGGLKEISVDVRLVSATNQDLKKMIEEGNFRHDLYFRLNVFRIHLPPLRDRGDDVLLLSHFFLQQFANDLRKNISGIHASAQSLLKKYSFPGNVRELRNVIERAVILCEETELMDRQFSDLMTLPDSLPDRDGDMPLNLEELESRAIHQALQKANGNQTEAAKYLGIGHDALRYRVKKYEIEI